jgi:hypothetical protein
MENTPRGIEHLDIAEEFVIEIMGLVRDNYKKDGFLQPVCFIGVQINPIDGKPLDSVDVVVISPAQLGISMADSSGTQRFTDCIRKISTACKAVMVVTAIEAWALTIQDEEVLKNRKHRSLEHAPGRTECIQIMMEHHRLGSKTKFWVASITRDEEGRGILSEFEGKISDKAEGRFIGFITPPS